jgi:hypothetical protein
MIVDNLDIHGVGTGPKEANAVLVVDANTALPRTVALQLFKTQALPS